MMNIEDFKKYFMNLKQNLIVPKLSKIKIVSAYLAENPLMFP